MKKLLFLSMMCLMALTMNAQRCAVMEFKAGVGISQADVDGISAIFTTYFRPSGYTMVERTQIDKAIEEQGFQRSRMTESQMVRIGQILNVSKIVIGDVNVVMGSYNVDVRVINVETGTIAATSGKTFSGSTYRTTMQSMAQELAGQIAIKPGSTVMPSGNTAAASTRTRSKVEVIYGYLKVFPTELGTFQSEPANVIAQINKQAQHGYNNWRIPTNEELSLLRANNYLGGGEYMTRENKRGIVLLVTDGKDYATLLAEEQERAAQAEQERRAAQAEQERREREKAERDARLKAQGLVDLGLSVYWKDQNESGGFYSYDQAVSRYGRNLPTKEQFEELTNKCRWTWESNGYKVTGPNGNSIFLPAAGGRDCNGYVINVGSGKYWSSSSDGSGIAWALDFNRLFKNMHYDVPRCRGLSVRLVQDK